MVNDTGSVNDGSLKKRISEELRSKANDFLNSRKHANNLVDIIGNLDSNLEQKLPITPSLLTLEVVFVQLLKRKEMCLDDLKQKSKDENSEMKYRQWVRERFDEAMRLILKSFLHEKNNEACQALITSIKLLAAEGKSPLEKGDTHGFPKYRLRRILQNLLSSKKLHNALIQRFKEFTEYFDVVFYCWKLLPHLATEELFKNRMLALNYLELLNVLPVPQDTEEPKKLLCLSQDAIGDACYEYIQTRKNVNKTWQNLMQWNHGMNEAVHKQLLIVLLERIMQHLDRPVLLTDFLIDSLDVGGPVSLLALQGIFTLIQKHNITYPNIYEKLYQMFEPEIFHMKFKARLFYLADIFLSSTHLPENLVAGFAKRLARLSLIAPPQDAIIITYFIGNLILRHPGLKRLISATTSMEVNADPFIMEELDPSKSNAIESSLWELVLLQKHAIPSVAIAAKFITQPLPSKEWDLASVLDVKEEDIFDQEISKNAKQYALAFERPNTIALASNEKVTKYFKLF